MAPALPPAAWEECTSSQISVLTLTDRSEPVAPRNTFGSAPGANPPHPPCTRTWCHANMSSTPCPGAQRPTSPVKMKQIISS